MYQNSKPSIRNLSRLAALSLAVAASSAFAAPITAGSTGSSSASGADATPVGTTSGTSSNANAPAQTGTTSPIFLLNDTGGIYSLQAGTGATSFYRNTQMAAAGKLNAFAYDPMHDDFYYINDATRKLYRNTGSVESEVMTMPSGSYANATFFGTSFWTVKNGSTTLLQVDVADPNMPITRSFTLTGQPNLSFGDIAVNSQGTVFGAAQGNFFRFDLSSILPTSTTVTATTLSTDSPNLQLAFMDNGLYGISTDTDQVFLINPYSGSRTQVSTLSNTSIRTQDAAGFIPEPASIAPLAGGSLLLLRRKR